MPLRNMYAWGDVASYAHSRRPAVELKRLKLSELQQKKW